MWPVQLLAFIASLPLGFGTAYVIGYAISFFVLAIRALSRRG
jgi:hypothetical protein